MRAASILLGAHLFALVFGLIGMLVMIPHPWLWVGSPILVQVFSLSMQHAGVLHILLGAAAMLAFGVQFVGPRKTLIFFVVSTVLSCSFELLGTGTGWPFGAYEYTEGLGAKVGGRVPYTIPLSWFYMGFASYLLAGAIVGRLARRHVGPWTVLLGSWFLMVWDLVLDPAMAHESLPIRFWIWHQTGPYFGMPLQNFAGWYATGLLFMAVSRWLWRGDVAPNAAPALFSLVMYAANVLFGMVLSGSVGLWVPILLAVVLGLGPASVAWRPSLTRAPVLARGA